MTSNRYPSRYRPGFAEHKIPDPWAWVDVVMPPVTIVVSIVGIIGAVWSHLP